jgi:hypothetical protein
MPARNICKYRPWTPDKVRERIQTTQITKRLQAHVMGEVEMTTTQITAALGLLRKTLPDLTAVSHSGTIEHTRAEDLSDAVLADIAVRGSNRAVEAPVSEEIPDEFH